MDRSYFGNSIFLILISLLIGSGLFGCQGIMDMDRPIPQKKFLWKKKGVTTEEVNKELSECSRRAVQRLGDVSAREIGEASDICMLKKGFKFVPNSGEYRNICLIEPFTEMPSCKSYRGEYQESQ